MRQREMLEFRTPQHPSSSGLGTNTWGGASPLLARNIPKESLEQKYLRLNTIRVRDEIFSAEDESFDSLPKTSVHKQECPPTPSRNRKQNIMKLLFTPMRKKSTTTTTMTTTNTATLGRNSKKKSWFPRMDPQKRWPQVVFSSVVATNTRAPPILLDNISWLDSLLFNNLHSCFLPIHNPYDPYLPSTQSRILRSAANPPAKPPACPP
ncbi:hypothetical protein PS1_035997 [Malus domestica]